MRIAGYTLARITDFVKKKAMLDLSDKDIVPQSTAHSETEVAVSSGELPAPAAGNRFRHYKGGLYQIVGTCTIEATQELGVLYQTLDPLARQDIWLRPVSDFYAVVSQTNGTRRFAPLHMPSTEGLHHYVTASLVPPTVLEQVLARYDEPGRFFHARWHVLDLFERAKARGLALSPEQVIAILFHDAVYVPGVPEGTNEKLSALLLKSMASLLGSFNVELACRIIEDTAQHKASTPESGWVLDLDLAGLADEALQFCATNELVWLENRHLLEEASGRKDFDTRRLKFLLNMANRGPLYHTPEFGELESQALANLEGLRQAWVQKYNKGAA